MNTAGIFLTVARYQHITRAAKVLSISQPALSQAISKLETELDVPLFERSGRNVQLSRYGTLFSENVERAVRELKHGKKNVRRMVEFGYRPSKYRLSQYSRSRLYT
ncbi:LysR family transcriptional regulator [Paenibacillus sp. NPDC058071]|uniref:LysR family transcriptional regulator n=1 Tax=Paenibacillus sp. NPDC058071 TaxID=3346326 RepID=UPI0036D81E78